MLGQRLPSKPVSELPAQLEEILKRCQKINESTSVNDLELPERLADYATSLLNRFERFGELGDLDCAVDTFRRAIDLTSGDDSALARRLSSLASALRARFDHFGEPGDLEGAFEANDRAIQLTPGEGHPEFLQLLTELGLTLLTRFRRRYHLLMTSFADVDDALHSARSAVELTPIGEPALPERLRLVATCLRIRFQHFHVIDELECALDACRRAMDLTSPGSFGYALLLDNLAVSLLTRFESPSHNRLEDLEEALALGRQAVELASENRLELARLLSNLGVLLWTHYELLKKLGDLDDAVNANRRAIDLTPDGHVDLSGRLSRLATSLRNRFQRTGERNDLENAVSSDHRAVDYTPDNDPQLPQRLRNLATSLCIRFDRLGELSDIESAIQANYRALDCTTVNEYNREFPHLLSSLASSLRYRFERTGDLADLEKSIQASLRSVELKYHVDPQLPRYLCIHATSLLARFYRFEELKDLEEALHASEQAVTLTPDDDPELPQRILSLVASLQAFYHHDGDLSNLERALELNRRAIGLTSGKHPHLPLQLSCCATLLRARYERFAEPTDIESALETHRQAVCLTPEDDPKLAMQLDDLAASFHARFERSSNLADIDDALEAECRSVDLTPNDHSERPKRLNNLGWLYRARFAASGTREDFDAAVYRYMEASSRSPGNPRWRFQSAESCIQMLSDKPEFSTLESLLLAHSRILESLPDLLWLGYSARRRFLESANVGGLVNAAVRCAIEVGDIRRAVEWFDAGRALVWSQTVSMRTSLVELEKVLPEHASVLKNEIYPELQRLGFHVQSDTAYTHAAIATEAYTGRAVPRKDPLRPRSAQVLSAIEEYRQVAIAYDKLLKDIRGHDGFGEFMRPMKFDILTSSSLFTRSCATVVLINVDKVRCDALVLSSSADANLVKLPGLTQSRAEKLRSLWISCVGLDRFNRRGAVSLQNTFVRGGSNLCGRVLNHLWTWVVQPILEALQLQATKTYDTVHDLPHVIWCPTGPLTQLPLHAAGIYDNDQEDQRAYKFAVYSYTPSLSSLIDCCQGIREQPLPPTLLVVTQANTPRPGLPPLPCVRDESNRLRALMNEHGHWNSLLEGETATRFQVLFTALEHSWIHFACHGSQSSIDPTLSSIELYDGPLPLYQLTGSSFDNAELAFLSACETAVGDPKIPGENAHLAAGMLAAGFKGVVATMWSIRDQDAPIIVEAYYKKLLELRSTGTVRRGETGAAHALHEAVRCLREKVGESQFERWVPFVHFGI